MRRGVDWSWARYEVGRAAEVPRRPEPPAVVGPSIVFARSRAYWLGLAGGVFGLALLAVWARDRVRVTWSETEVGIGDRRLARADVREIRRGPRSIVLIAGTDRVPIVRDRPARDDVDGARVLAHALRVPFVDETGARAPLPVARAR